MGIFDSIDYEEMMEELRQIWGADDRVTGMIPDTYDDPSGIDSYGKRYLDRMTDYADRAWSQMPRKGGSYRSGRNFGRGLLSGELDYNSDDGYARSDFGAGDRLSPFSSYQTEDGGNRFGLDDPTSPNRISVNRLASDAAQWIRDNNDELVDQFSRGVSLAEDNESFIDRQTYLPDGTVGSEERARAYKAEGGRELLRGIGYGVVDTADAMLGLVAGEDDPYRRPTQRMLDSLAYKESGDEGIDMPLDAMHSLGEGIGETIATGIATGAVRSGIQKLAPYIPRDLRLKSPDFIRDNVPYQMQNVLDKIPHPEDFLNTRLGSHILDFVSDGVVNTAMIRQIANRENWSSEEFEQAMVAATALSTLGVGIATRPRTKKEWSQPIFVHKENPLGRRYDEIAMDFRPKFAYGYEIKKDGKKGPYGVLHDKHKNPIYAKIKKYGMTPAQEKNKERRKLLMNGNPILLNMGEYPPDPYMTGVRYRVMKEDMPRLKEDSPDYENGMFYNGNFTNVENRKKYSDQWLEYKPNSSASSRRDTEKVKKKHSEGWSKDYSRDWAKDVRAIDNEEIEVDVWKSEQKKREIAVEKAMKKRKKELQKEAEERGEFLSDTDLDRLENEDPVLLELAASLEPPEIPAESFIPQEVLKPTDSFIMEKELERVFGKYAKLERTNEDRFHVTLPNGVELNVESYQEIPLDYNHVRGIIRKYGLPNRTIFSLKGNLANVDSYALIQLRHLRDSETLQHQAVHFALKTVTTRKEQETLRKLFGKKEEDQVAGIMQAIAEERRRDGDHPNVFLRKVLRRIENFGGYINEFVKNVPTALAKRDWSYLTGQTPKSILRDYAQSFVDGSIWGHEIAPVMREFIDEHREGIAKAILKENSKWFDERAGLAFYDRSPNIVSILGMPNHPMSMDNNIFNKILLEKHSEEITAKHLERIPEALEHPVLIVRADWTSRGKTSKERAQNAEHDQYTYNFVLDMVDNYDANIMVPIGFNYNGRKGFSNKIKSIYGLATAKSKASGQAKFDINKFIDMLRSSKLAYVDPEKALEIIKKHKPQAYVKMRDYLYRRLPKAVFTPEKYRQWRKSRGMKPSMEPNEYFENGV